MKGMVPMLEDDKNFWWSDVKCSKALRDFAAEKKKQNLSWELYDFHEWMRQKICQEIEKYFDDLDKYTGYAKMAGYHS
jgi:hypothetical protein